jgi:hypothetical protein
MKPFYPLLVLAVAGSVGSAEVPDSSAFGTGSTAPARVVPAKADASSLILTLDLADITAEGLQQRHFHTWPKQADYCCVDLAWYPATAFQGAVEWGASANLGGWRQTLSQDWSHVAFTDAAAGASFLYDPGRRSGIWARADLGGSVLLVHRTMTGVAPGLAGQVRVGYGFRALDRDCQVSVGTDARWWPALDVRQDPALILSLGGRL